MEFVSDPAVSVKIRKMRERVRWRDPLIVERDIDQTRLVLEDGQEDGEQFSFLVIGDTGAGPHLGQNPQRQVAEQLLAHRDECRFLLHTGDVIYLVGSSEFYRPNFIEPYREFIHQTEPLDRVRYDQMTFNFPFLPVPGNHDYYDLPFLSGLIIQSTWPIRYLLRSKLDFDVGWHGSKQGRAYARAFLDVLGRIEQDESLAAHLDRHYTAQVGDKRCLGYRPGVFTRLPNRYYSFRAGGIDFFALDSNTFNAPTPLPQTGAGENSRQLLERKQEEIERERQQILEATTKLDREDPEQAEELDDLRTRLQQLDEMQMDITKQLDSGETASVDFEQLEWLRERLVASWNDPGVRGRVVYLHHPPYVTEATKWQQAQTLTIRRRLRQVFDRVVREVGASLQNRPVIDLMLTGHAHCLEYLRTLDTGHGDANLNVLVCGGSGYSLRRQRVEGMELTETLENRHTNPVAQSRLYVGYEGTGSHRRRPYSFLRIDVQPGNPVRFLVRPYISERFKQQWHHHGLKPFVL